MKITLALLSLAVAAVSTSATAQTTSQQIWDACCKTHHAKTNPAVPLAPSGFAKSTPPASNDTKTANGIAVIVVYDSKCETLPKAVMRAAELASAGISKQAMETETTDVLAWIQPLGGVGDWCAAIRPHVHAFMKAIH